MTLTLYVRGDTFLHRLPAAAKLAVLLVAGILLFTTSSVPVLGACAALAGVLLASARPPASWLRTQFLGVSIILAIVFAATAFFDGWGAALAVLFRLASLVLLASAVTLTTRTSDLLEVCEKALRPLERLGLVDASRVSLAVSLVLRFVPEMFKHYRDIREAQAARGLEGNPVALVVPLVVRTLKAADDISAAIDARCYPPVKPASFKTAARPAAIPSSSPAKEKSP